MLREDLVRELIDALNHCPAKVQGSCDWCEFNRDGTCLVSEAFKYVIRIETLQKENEKLKKDYSTVTSSLRSERDELDAFILSLDYMVTPFEVTISKAEDGTYTITREFKADSAKDILDEIEGL